MAGQTYQDPGATDEMKAEVQKMDSRAAAERAMAKHTPPASDPTDPNDPIEMAKDDAAVAEDAAKDANPDYGLGAMSEAEDAFAVSVGEQAEALIQSGSDPGILGKIFSLLSDAFASMTGQAQVDETPTTDAGDTGAPMEG